MQARHALFLSTLFLSATALAGEPPAPPMTMPMPPQGADMPHHHTPEQMVQHMDRQADLKLSDSQKQQMQAALQDEHSQMEAAHLKSKERMAQILTPEQQAKLDQHRAEMRAHRAERMERQADRLKSRADALKQEAAATPAAPMPAH